jgi:ERCC4-related helicase
MVMLIVRDTVDEAYYRVVQRKLKSLSSYVRQLTAENASSALPSPRPPKREGLDSFIG